MDVSDDSDGGMNSDENGDDEFQTWTMKDSVLFLIDAGGLFHIVSYFSLLLSFDVREN
jgi:hypothetical protein